MKAYITKHQVIKSKKDGKVWHKIAFVLSNGDVGTDFLSDEQMSKFELGEAQENLLSLNTQEPEYTVDMSFYPDGDKTRLDSISLIG